jgi:hypothetical protein
MNVYIHYHFNECGHKKWDGESICLLYRKVETRNMFGISRYNPTWSFFNTLLCTNRATNPCFVKTLKNSMAKNRERVHSITLCIALIASLKTICDKLQKKNTVKT